VGKVFVNPWDIYLLVIANQNLGMNKQREIYETRRRNLIGLMGSRYGGKQINLANAINMSPTYLSRVINGQKNMGEELSREIAQSLNLPATWLDANHDLPQMRGQLMPEIPAGAGVREVGADDYLDPEIYVSVPHYDV